MKLSPAPLAVPAVQVSIGEAERQAVMRVLQCGQLVQGSEVAAFEHEFSSQVVDGGHCVAVNSGTSALHLSLLALGIGGGDEVIVPSFTFAATANAVRMAGGTPVFVDIDAQTFTLDPAAVEAAITPRTRAVIPVHLYGQTADLEALSAVVAAHGLAMIEDAAQAHAAAHRGRPAGSWGDCAAFSFYATKNMTTGEGGMVVCRDPEVARRVRLLRNQGMEVKYRNEIPGLNNRMTDLAAAIGRVQLKSLPHYTQRRQEIADQYRHGLRDLTCLRVPYTAPENLHVYHQFTITSPIRDQLLTALTGADIGAAVYYPVPTHRLPAYDLDISLPVTDQASTEVLSLPVHPSLSDAQIARVIEVLRDSAGADHA